MNLFKSLGLTLVLCAAPLLSSAASTWPMSTVNPATAGFSPERLDKLHVALRTFVDNGSYSGYIELLARDGKIVDWRAHGWQDIAAQKPMQKDSIVRIYSMSKIITSTAILMLLEEGKLRLGDPVEKFLPALKDRQVLVGGTADAPVLAPAERAINVRDLLTHTAGYYYGESWSAEPVPMELMNRAKIWDAANLDEFVARVATLPLSEQPGTRFRYGINTDLLGAIVEKVSGQRLNVFFEERIFKPLAMRDTGFWVPAEKRARLAIVYSRGPDGKLVPNDWANRERATPEGGILSGGGGLFSTAGDYARFAQMLLNGGQLDGVRLLSRKTVELMTQNHIAHLKVPHPFNIPSQGFGLGVRVVTDLGASTTIGTPGTFGWDGAATTVVQMDPKERTVAILLTQHMPFNQDDILATFTNCYYAAIAN